MKTAVMFPGQGSQTVGMGAELFDRFPEQVAVADQVLGYSIKELCLDDPRGVINQTQFTQPALFFVNALSYLAYKEENDEPDVLLGHSLGEFTALWAAGAFDLATGLKIVAKRGELMSQAKGGAMAAVIGVPQWHLISVLDEQQIETVDFANLNSAEQIVVSGASEGITRLAGPVEEFGGRYIPLKVSAAFHSRYMKDAQSAFEEFLNSIEFKELTKPVTANVTADYYPTNNYQYLLVEQLASPVQWYQGVSSLISQGVADFQEVGPGKVLTNLYKKISANPWQVPVTKKNIFMYSGQGSQYYQMGRELFEQDEVFRRTLTRCDSIVLDLTKRSILDHLYGDRKVSDAFDNIEFTHPALFSFGYSLTKALISRGLSVDAVFGYSLGEYVAATIADALTLEQALKILTQQASALASKSRNGGMLTVLAPVAHFYDRKDLYEKVDLAGINYQENFVVSGKKAVLIPLQAELDQLGIANMLLPVEHGFHSSEMKLVETDFKQVLGEVQAKAPQLPMHSATIAGLVNDFDSQHFWQVTRGETRFDQWIENLTNKEHYRFIDLSPTGTLSTFLKYSDHDVEHYSAINPFGRNMESVDRLVAQVTGTQTHSQ